MKSSFSKSVVHFFNSISTKVILVMLAFILPLNILAIHLSQLALNNVMEQTQNSVTNVLENYITDIEERMSNSVALLYTITSNNEDGKIVKKQLGDTDYQFAKYRLHAALLSTLRMAKSADGAFLYMEKLDDKLIWSLDYSIHSSEDISNWILSQAQNGITPGWHLYYLDEQHSSAPILSLFTEHNGVYSGSWLELGTIEKNLKKNLQYDHIDITFTEGSPLDDSEDMVISSYLKKADMYINVTLDTEEINGSILKIYLIFQTVAIVFLLLIPILYLFLRRLLIAPLHEVNHAHQELESGNPEYRIGAKAHSVEFQKAYQSFNRMAERIKLLKISNYEKELDRQKTELKNLQLQIRPHFLINTFNLIYNLAQEKDVEHVQEVILYLSDYFRHIFRSGKDLELFGTEQRLIEEYIGTANIRYPDSIEATYEYDECISLIRVPPLLIHNFVENIVKHVVKQDVLTHISITGHYNDGFVTFTIEDNGQGIPPEQVTELNAQIRSGSLDGSHVGMTNAYRRLKYFYGSQADIAIASQLGAGTTVTIYFPYTL